MNFFSATIDCCGLIETESVGRLICVPVESPAVPQTLGWPPAPCPWRKRRVPPWRGDVTRRAMAPAPCTAAASRDAIAAEAGARRALSQR